MIEWLFVNTSEHLPHDAYIYLDEMWLSNLSKLQNCHERSQKEQIYVQSIGELIAFQLCPLARKEEEEEKVAACSLSCIHITCSDAGWKGKEGRKKKKKNEEKEKSLNSKYFAIEPKLMNLNSVLDDLIRKFTPLQL